LKKRSFDEDRSEARSEEKLRVDCMKSWLGWNEVEDKREGTERSEVGWTSYRLFIERKE
jgi:hypothetical protein